MKFNESGVYSNVSYGSIRSVNVCLFNPNELAQGYVLAWGGNYHYPGAVDEGVEFKENSYEDINNYSSSVRCIGLWVIALLCKCGYPENNNVYNHWA